MGLLRLLILGFVAVGLAACSGSKTLHSNAPTGDGPDEFSIMPAKQLTQPKDYAGFAVAHTGWREPYGSRPVG